MTARGRAASIGCLSREEEVAMHLPRALLLGAALAAPAVPAAAQATDVGLTMTGGLLTVIYGQACGPVACTPFSGGAMAPGESRVIVHHAARNTPYVLAIGFAGPCTAFPGIENSLLLQLLPATLSVGVASAPSLTSVCPQAQARYQLNLPMTAPTGFSFRLQSLGVSNSGALAFGPAIDVQVP